MLQGADEPRSPAWWIKVLARQMLDRRVGRSTNGKIWSLALDATTFDVEMRPGLDLIRSYRTNNPPLLGFAEAWQPHFREIARMSEANMAELIVDAKANRMQLRSFRTAAVDDELGDKEAVNLMYATNAEVWAHEVHDNTLTYGVGYSMATPPARNQRYPVVTAEDPRETITAHNPATNATMAGLKLFRDEWDSADFAYLFKAYDDGPVYKHVAVSRAKTTAIGRGPFHLGDTWEWLGEPELVGVMPITRYLNRKRGTGEFERHIGALNRINSQILDKMVISKIQAFRQRAIKGLPETERIVQDGKIVEREIDYSDAFVAAPGALWQVPEGVDFWESAPVDLSSIRLSIKDDLIQLAAQTQTALPSVTPDAASGSAEGASLMREEMVYATEKCIAHMNVSHANTLATCFAFMGDTERADVTQIRPIWGPVERFSLSERADAASKAGTSLPQEAIQRDIWQYDPAEIPNLRTMRGRDMLFNFAPSTNGNTPVTARSAPS